MGKGQNTTTQNTSTSPNPQAMAAYQSLLQQAGGVAATPYQSYGGELVAPVNQQQNLGISGINSNANFAQPYVQGAIGQAQNASAPITQQQIQQYMSPYTQNVVNATQAQFNNQNQQQQQQVQGNAISQGALGGNRTAVAQAQLANQQQLAQAPVIAGLENQGYTTGLNTALSQQQAGLQGANAIGSLGVAGQNAGLTGANAQIGAGSLQQNTQQALDAALMGQFQQQQAYPFQTTQWLAGLDTGVGSQMGGTSTGTTTAPAPNQLGSILGGLTSATGILGGTGAFGSAGWLAPALMALARGGAVPVTLGRSHGGGVAGYATGGAPNGVAGVPWANAPTYVPQMNITHGPGAPQAHAPAPYQPPQSNLNQQAGALGQLAKSIKDGINGTPDALPYGSPIPGAAGDTSVGGPQGPAPLYGGTQSNPLPGLSSDDYEFARGGVAGFADGGGVAGPTIEDRKSLIDQDRRNGYAEGGTPSDSFDDRFGAVYDDPSPSASSTAPKDSDVIPDPGFQKVNPKAVQAWRDGVDADNGVTPNQIALGVMPDTSTEASGVAPKSTRTSFAPESKTDQSLPPEVALGYSRRGPAGVAMGSTAPADDDTPAPKSRGLNIDFGADSKLWPALISAGFGMMASRSPFLGNQIGEGGQAGVASYNLQRQQEVEAKNAADKLDLERQKFNRPYQEMTKSEQNAADQAKAQQEALEEQKRIENAIKLKTPIQILPAQPGQYGLPDTPPLMAIPRINDKGELELYPINRDGTISRTPIQQGGGTSDPTTTPPVNPARPSPTPPAATAPATPPGATPAPGTPLTRPALPPATENTPPAQTGATPPSQSPAATAAPDANTPPLNAKGQPPNPAAPPGDPDARNETFYKRVATINPSYALALKKAADYDLDPSAYASLRGTKGDAVAQRMKFINDVLAYDPNYQPSMFASYNQARKSFYSGPRADQIGAYNTAISHLDILRDLYKALNNKDSQTWNRIANTFEQEFGYPAPNNLSAANQIIGNEVIKAVVGAHNALGDRQEAAENLKRDLSNGQAEGVINTYQRLMLGQLESKKHQYEATTHLHNFDSFLMPHTLQVFKRVADESGGSIKPIPDFGERKKFKEGVGVWNGKTFIPEDQFNKKYKKNEE